MYIYINLCIHTYIHTCMHACIYTCIHTYILYLVYMGRNLLILMITVYIYFHLCANIHYVVTSYFLILYMYIDLALLY